MDEVEIATSAEGRYRYRFAGAEFDEVSSRLSVNGIEVAMEPRPLRLLLELLRHVNEVVTKEELFQVVWEGRPTVDNVLANAVVKLRKALGATASACIVNVPRIGYRLVGAVERIAAGRFETRDLGLNEGQVVPGRESFRLSCPLSRRGNVWLAIHPRLGQQRVFKFASDAETLRLLKREFTLYRVLSQELPESHSFAKVLDSNFSEAPYFIECEYGGPDMQAWAAQGHLAVLDSHQRLALFLQIARAVVAAHSVGVLHKDLKPANVLISGMPGNWHARLTDFGSGRALDPERLRALGLTALGMTMTQAADADALSGTPLYLAPEVLAGQPPTTQSDLYALGVMLYQMLAGDLRRPLATGWQRDVGNELLIEDIVAATLGRPAERLGGAAELVERLATLDARRAQQQQQTEAQRREQDLRADWQRRRIRRPWLVAAFASLVLGLVASLWFYRQSAQAVTRTQQESARSAAISNFLHRDVLEADDAVSLGSVVKPKSMLEILRQASNAAAQRFAGEPLTEARIHRRFAETFIKLASTIDVDHELKRSTALLEPMVPADDEELLVTRFLSARLLAWRLQFSEASHVLEQAEQLAGASRLAQPSELALVAARARCQYFADQNQWASVLPAAKRLLMLADTLGDLNKQARMDARRLLAEAYFYLGQQAEVARLLVELAAPPFSVKFAANEFYGRVYVTRGSRLASEGRLAEAEKDLLKALDWLAAEGTQTNDFEAAFVESSLGNVYLATGNFARSTREFEAAQARFEKIVGPDHQYVASMRMIRAVSLLEQGQLADAKPWLNQVERWSNEVPERQRFTNQVSAYAQAVMQIEQRHAAQALRGLEAIDIARLQRQSDLPDAKHRVDYRIGQALLALGRWEEGLQRMEAALAEMKNAGSWPWLVERWRRGLEAVELHR